MKYELRFWVKLAVVILNICSIGYMLFTLTPPAFLLPVVLSASLWLVDNVGLKKYRWVSVACFCIMLLLLAGCIFLGALTTLQKVDSSNVDDLIDTQTIDSPTSVPLGNASLMTEPPATEPPTKRPTDRLVFNDNVISELANKSIPYWAFAVSVFFLFFLLFSGEMFFLDKERNGRSKLNDPSENNPETGKGDQALIKKNVDRGE